MEWRADWIWARSHRETPNFYLYARREFEVHASSSARVFVTCSSEYKLYMNGRYVGRGPSPCHPSFQYYDDYDISHLVRPGRNAIGLICYNQGIDTPSRPRAPGGLLLQAEFHNSQDVEFVVSDETWRVKPAEDWDFSSERMSEAGGFREVYDSRKKPVAWGIVGYDDSRWDTPDVIGPAANDVRKSLLPRPIPHLRETEVFAEMIVECGPAEALDAIKYANAMLDSSADSTSIGTDSYVILDFGGEVIGYPRIGVRDGAAAEVEIGYGEAADARLSDRLVLHGGRQEWEGFSRRAFRHMRLTFRNLAGAVHIESVSANRVGYPVEQVSSFECSDDALNRAWQNGVDALGACMQDTYERRPALDDGQHIADARVQALANYYCFFDTKLAAKTLSEFAQSQSEDGRLGALWPSATCCPLPLGEGLEPPPDPLPRGGGIADESLAWVLMLHDYHLYTADRSLSERLYPNLHLLIDGWCRGEQDARGLLSPHTGPSVDMVSYNALFYQALRHAAKLASSLGAIDDSVEWMARAEIVREAFNERYWSDGHGAYAAGNQTASLYANSLAVLYGLADARRCASIRDSVLRESPGQDESLSDFGVLEALARLGGTGTALAEIRRKWGGAPSTRASSHSSGPVYLLSAEVLGVKPSMPGSGVVVVQPKPDDLAWAKGTIKTQNCTVDVEWQCGPRQFAMEISAPEGFIAALPIGRFHSPEIQEIDLSPDTPERRARKTYGWTDLVWRDGVEHDPYLDWLETQETRPPDDYRARKRLFREEEYIWVRESTSTHVRYEMNESA